MSFRQGFAEALVVSKRLPKTVTVAVWRKHLNKKYKVFKTVKSTLMVHDEMDECVPGDRVVIKQCRPMSKQKRFTVFDIIKKYKPAEFLQNHPEYLSTRSEGSDVLPTIPRKQTRKIGQGPAAKTDDE
eukprot:TRINITY_DN1972_c0_g1_i1.p3 TRINITY_DN1972_c0_g1~~TRINITY_DN1972_c0_g1_i1.p3  ORF type:complete len:128 (-),score=18.10 TRINITY_DN1972_c0_g1_i1:607-990(-)